MEYNGCAKGCDSRSGALLNFGGGRLKRKDFRSDYVSLGEWLEFVEQAVDGMGQR